jgi:hypothetical protein
LLFFVGWCKGFYLFMSHFLVMGFVHRFLALMFVCLVLASLFVISVKSDEAYAASKPSVPEFTVKLVDYSYDVPPVTTTTTNEYTGEKTTTTTPGYRVENKTVEVTITNQPFTPYTDANRITYYLYYIVQAKGRFGEDWQDWGSTVQTINPYGGGFWGATSEYLQGSLLSSPANYAAGAQVDFRVEAIIGHYVPEKSDLMFPRYWFETDVSSGWSKVQTFTMPDGSSTQPPSQTPTQPTNLPATSNNNQPHQSEQNQILDFMSHPLFLLGVGALVGVGLTIIVLVFTRRRMKILDYNNSSLTN